MKKRFLFLMTILCLVVMAVALICVAAAPVSAVNQMTTGVAVMLPTNGVAVTSATLPTRSTGDYPYSYYIIFGTVILLSTLTLVALRRYLTQWRLLSFFNLTTGDKGALAAGDQLKFPILAGC